MGRNSPDPGHAGVTVGWVPKNSGADNTRQPPNSYPSRDGIARAFPSRRSHAQGSGESRPIAGRPVDTPCRCERRQSWRIALARDLDVATTKWRTLPPNSTPHPRSAKGGGGESRSPSLARERRGRESASALVFRWVEIRGLAWVAWPRISGHPSDAHACVPRMAIDFPRRRPPKSQPRPTPDRPALPNPRPTYLFTLL